MSLAPDAVLIKPTKPASLPSLTALLDGDEQVSGGVGGWTDLDRPRRVSAVEYVGTPAFVRTIPLLITGMEQSPGEDDSVEDQCQLLYRLGRRTAQTGEPPLLQISGDGLVLKAATMRWVITGINLGLAVRADSGRRIQQALELTLQQHVDAQIQKRPAKAARDRKKRGADWGPQ